MAKLMLPSTALHRIASPAAQAASEAMHALNLREAGDDGAGVAKMSATMPKLMLPMQALHRTVSPAAQACLEAIGPVLQSLVPPAETACPSCSSTSKAPAAEGLERQRSRSVSFSEAPEWLYFEQEEITLLSASNTAHLEGELDQDACDTNCDGAFTPKGSTDLPIGRFDCNGDAGTFDPKEEGAFTPKGSSLALPIGFGYPSDEPQTPKAAAQLPVAFEYDSFQAKEPVTPKASAVLPVAFGLDDLHESSHGAADEPCTPKASVVLPVAFGCEKAQDDLSFMVEEVRTPKASAGPPVLEFGSNLGKDSWSLGDKQSKPRKSNSPTALPVTFGCDSVEDDFHVDDCEARTPKASAAATAPFFCTPSFDTTASPRTSENHGRPCFGEDAIFQDSSSRFATEGCDHQASPARLTLSNL